jgi:hypothetical protein
MNVEGCPIQSSLLFFNPALLSSRFDDWKQECFFWTFTNLMIPITSNLACAGRKKIRQELCLFGQIGLV